MTLPTASKDPPLVGHGGQRLLVIDDDSEFTDFVAAVAQEMGFVVTAICDSEAFPEAFGKGAEVVALDLTMPGLDGIELIRYMSELHSSARLILMSGFDTHVLHAARELATARHLNVVAALQKPLRISDLEDALYLAVRHQSEAEADRKPCFAPDEDDLREALAAHAFDVHFQPQIAIDDGTLFGLEALARWQIPDYGPVPPELFIAAAERHQLIGELSDQILALVLDRLAPLRPDYAHLQVSYNLSPLLLHDVSLPDRLARQIKGSRIPPEKFTIEITESALVDHLETALDVLARLRMKGFHLSIDDFGTGYSSLVQLKRIPFTELKIDRGFISVSDSDARNIVESTIELGRRLGLRIVAEGVETREEFEMLKRLRCGFAQGYLFARPMPVDELRRWLDEYSGPDGVFCRGE